MITEVVSNLRFRHRLLRRTDHTRDCHHGRLMSHLLVREFQDRLIKPDLPDCELRCMDTHGDTARARRKVIASQSPLPAFVELPFRIQRQRMCRDYQPLK